MDRISKLVAGAVGMALIAAFLLGLANSIKAAPFWVITVGVLALALFDFWQECVRRTPKN